MQQSGNNIQSFTSIVFAIVSGDIKVISGVDLFDSN